VKHIHFHFVIVLGFNFIVHFHVFTAEEMKCLVPVYTVCTSKWLFSFILCYCCWNGQTCTTTSLGWNFIPQVFSRNFKLHMWHMVKYW